MNQENLEDRIISERELDAVLREKLIKMISDIDKKEISKEVKPKPEDKRRIELEDGEKVKPLPKHPKHLPPKHKLQGILNIEEDFETSSVFEYDWLPPPLNILADKFFNLVGLNNEDSEVDEDECNGVSLTIML